MPNFNVRPNLVQNAESPLIDQRRLSANGFKSTGLISPPMSKQRQEGFNPMQEQSQHFSQSQNFIRQRPMDPSSSSKQIQDSTTNLFNHTSPLKFENSQQSLHAQTLQAMQTQGQRYWESQYSQGQTIGKAQGQPQPQPLDQPQSHPHPHSLGQPPLPPSYPPSPTTPLPTRCSKPRICQSMIITDSLAFSKQI